MPDIFRENFRYVITLARLIMDKHRSGEIRGLLSD
jgi:hypothetical protein